jgi:diguanylate cyclase (GGDEF)-like protein
MTDAAVGVQEIATGASALAARLALVRLTAHALAAPTSVDELCQKLVNTIYMTMGHDFVTVYLREGRRLRLTAYRSRVGNPAEKARNLMVGEGIIGHVALTNSPYLSHDTSNDSYFLNAADLVATRAEVAVPMSIGEDVYGVINVESPVVGAFTDEDTATLMAVADQAVTALRGARLYETEAALRIRAEKRSLRLEHIQRVGRRLKLELDEYDVALRVVDAAREALGFRVAILNLFDRPGESDARARVVATTGLPEEARLALQDHDFSLMSTLELFQPEFLISHSYFIPCERSPLVASSEVPWWSPPIQNEGSNAWRSGDELLVPLVEPRRDHLLGFLSVDDPESGQRPEREDIEVLEVFADQAVVALRNAHLLAQTRRLAERDTVTGLLNHRAAHQQLDVDLTESRLHGRRLGVLAIDMDDFKLINDTHGHSVGDMALRHIARLLERCVRAGDTIARLGGDEFLVILPGASRERCLELVDQLMVRVHENPLRIDGLGDVPLRLSGGVAVCPEDTTQSQGLLTIADSRLYEAKRAGGRTMEAGVRRNEREGRDLAGFDMLSALVTAVDNKDRYTREHSEVVASVACALADALGLSRESQRTLGVAGLLHDVGKIGVPDRVLRKPGRLLADEWEVMKHHVALSTILISAIGLGVDVTAAVAHHHERWDGTGYPAGLTGAAVPLLGRIMIVADAVSAMALDRPYRSGLPMPLIVAELRAGAGTQFDASLVEPCVGVLGRLFPHSPAQREGSGSATPLDQLR